MAASERAKRKRSGGREQGNSVERAETRRRGQQPTHPPAAPSLAVAAVAARGRDERSSVEARERGGIGRAHV